jgi:hypothetical protein
MLKKVGDRVEVDEPLAQTKGMFGLFKAMQHSKVAGTIESISEVTGQVIVRGDALPVQVQAYLTGEVVEVFAGEGVAIEAEVTFVQGIFGIGGEAFGPVRVACRDHAEELTPAHIQPDMQGAVLIGGGRMEGAAVRKAIEVGVSAIVSGGMDDQDLRDILGYDLGVAITGSERVGVTLVITEGFGDIAMAERTFDLLKSRAGDEASVNGATQIRAGVMRPEVLIPVGRGESAARMNEKHSGGALEIGTPVRIIRDPYFGRLGTVAALPPELRVLDSGSKARVLEVQCDDNSRVTVPRANVEIIET